MVPSFLYDHAPLPSNPSWSIELASEEANWSGSELFAIEYVKL